MAIEKRRVSDMPLVPTSELDQFDIFGWNKAKNESGRAPMSLLKGDEGKSAYELWKAQPGNANKTYAEYEAFNRQPALDASNEWSEMKPGIETLVTETEAAKDDAITAAENAETQANYAKEQGDEANTAAQEANAAKEGVEEAIEKAEEVAEHPPIIGADLYWYYWDVETQKYVKTDKYSKGDPGAGNVDIVNTSSVVKDVPYLLSPTANGAQTYNAVEAVVGGRNLIKGSAFNKLPTIVASGVSYTLDNAVTLNGYNSIKCTQTAAPHHNLENGRIYFDFGFAVKSKASIYVKATENITIKWRIGGTAQGTRTFDVGTEWAKISIDVDYIPANTYWLFGGQNIGDVFYLALPMCTVGTIPSDWSPAPEDKQDVINIPNNSVPFNDSGQSGEPKGSLSVSIANAIPITIPVRGAGGVVKVGNAVDPLDAVNLGQLMAQFRGNYEIVTTLPAVGVEGKMYLVTTSTDNVYNLKTWKQVSGVYKYVDLGSTSIDLSNYAKIADLNNKNDLHAIYGASNVDLDTVISPNKLVVKNYSMEATNKPPYSNNANGLLSIAIHPESGESKYYKQVAFSSNGSIYHRILIGTAWTPWVKLVNESDLTALAKKSTTKSATLTVANWVDDTANSGYWKYTVNDSDIAEQAKTEFYPATDSDVDKMEDAGVRHLGEEATGGFVIKSESKPTENININYIIFD